MDLLRCHLLEFLEVQCAAVACRESLIGRFVIGEVQCMRFQNGNRADTGDGSSIGEWGLVPKVNMECFIAEHAPNISYFWQVGSYVLDCFAWFIALLPGASQPWLLPMRNPRGQSGNLVPCSGYEGAVDKWAEE